MGGPPATVQRILRHSSISVTTGTYVEVIEAVQRDALDSMGSLFAHEIQAVDVDAEGVDAERATVVTVVVKTVVKRFGLGVEDPCSPRWGGRDSNPRPTDYQTRGRNGGRSCRYLLVPQCV
jgi:hypothetical protein